MKHRRHGRHAVKSTGGCMGMLAAAVAFGLLNMGVASAAPTLPDRAETEANRDRLVNAGQLTEEQQNKKDYGQGVSRSVVLTSRSSRSSARASTCRIR